MNGTTSATCKEVFQNTNVAKNCLLNVKIGGKTVL